MKVKVLHIIKSLGRGGAEMLLPETLREHNKEDFEFHYIYFLPWKNQLVTSIEEEGGIVENLPAKNNILLILQLNNLIKYVRTNNIQIVHCHLPWAGFIGRLLYIRTGIPVIYTEHNKQERYHFLTKLINRWSFSFQSMVIAVSEDVSRSIKKNITTNISIQVVPNGVDTKKFDKKHIVPIAHPDISEDNFVIGTVAVFRFQKRLLEWLEVFHKIHLSNPNARGIIVGDGPMRFDVEEKIRGLGLENVVKLAGLQTDVRPLLARMDVFMMSSIFEGLPIALLEAMSMGCIPVTTNAGGIGEVIPSDQYGFVVPVDQWTQLADKVESLIQNPTQCLQIKHAARIRIQQSYSLKQMVACLEDIYRKFTVQIS